MTMAVGVAMKKVMLAEEQNNRPFNKFETASPGI